MKISVKVIVVTLTLLCAVVFVFSLFKIATALNGYAVGEKTYDSIAADVLIFNESAKSSEAVRSTEVDESETSAPPKETEKEKPPVSVDFDTLLSQNRDVVGWLYCEDTPLSYPVAQSYDNDYYLRRMLNGKYNISGTVFMDYRCSADCSDLNTIIYGHNMDDDSMFGTFMNYKEQGYYDKHPVIWFLTPERDYKIELLAGYVTPSTSDAYDEIFSHEELDAHVRSAMEKSTFKSVAAYSSGDRIITLSTCSGEYETARYVLVGLLKPLNKK